MKFNIIIATLPDKPIRYGNVKEFYHGELAFTMKFYDGNTKSIQWNEILDIQIIPKKSN